MMWRQNADHEQKRETGDVRTMRRRHGWLGQIGIRDAIAQIPCR
jgi:hypothetical protein